MASKKLIKFIFKINNVEGNAYPVWG
jgi:hypothetical protein